MKKSLKFFSRVICKLFSHDWRYNFPPDSLPSRRICVRCHAKERLDISLLQYRPSDFADDSRTDEELIDKWFSYTQLFDLWFKGK